MTKHSGTRRVWVHVVLIVLVVMMVLNGFVGTGVGVPLRRMQPDSQANQSTGDQQAKRQRFLQQQHRYHGAEEGRHGELRARSGRAQMPQPEREAGTRGDGHGKRAADPEGEGEIHRARGQALTNAIQVPSFKATLPVRLLSMPGPACPEQRDCGPRVAKTGFAWPAQNHRTGHDGEHAEEYASGHVIVRSDPGQQGDERVLGIEKQRCAGCGHAH